MPLASLAVVAVVGLGAPSESAEALQTRSTTLSSAVSIPATKVAGCPVFPRTNWWNTDISAAPLHASSRAWMSHMKSGSGNIWPNFGQGKTGPLGGEPITVVRSSHGVVDPRFTFESESDQVGYPLGADARTGNSRDHHSIIVNADTCRVYEIDGTARAGDGTWTGVAGASWSLTSNALRPDSWTSANTAGTPIIAGLLRLSEVQAGRVTHALNVTMPEVAMRHVWPARHHPGPGRAYDSPNYPPMGVRLRLDPGFDIGRYRPDTQVVLEGLKHYGLVVMDRGPAWFFQGETSTEWKIGFLNELKTIPVSAFKAVDTTAMRTNPDSAAVR